MTLFFVGLFTGILLVHFTARCDGLKDALRRRRWVDLPRDYPAGNVGEKQPPNSPPPPPPRRVGS